jgi:hypothetical protein
MSPWARSELEFPTTRSCSLCAAGKNSFEFDYRKVGNQHDVSFTEFKTLGRLL